MINRRERPASSTHSPIRTRDRTINRRVLAFGAAAAMTPSFPAFAAHEDHGTPDASGSPATALEGDADAVALLQRASEALAALETFGFELETTRGSSTILEGFELKGVEGVVLRPVSIEAEVTIGLPIGEVTITAVGIDGEFWVQDPFSEGEWIALGGDPQIQSMINPDAIITSAVRLVQDARITGTEKVDGVETTVVEGTLDFFSQVESVINSADGPAPLAQYLAEGPRDITFWIDDENRVVEMEIRGPIFVTESDDVVRVIRFFDFNEPVQIQVPEGAGLP